MTEESHSGETGERIFEKIERIMALAKLAFGSVVVIFAAVFSMAVHDTKTQDRIDTIETGLAKELVDRKASDQAIIDASNERIRKWEPWRESVSGDLREIKALIRNK